MKFYTVVDREELETLVKTGIPAEAEFTEHQLAIDWAYTSGGVILEAEIQEDNLAPADHIYEDPPEIALQEHGLHTIDEWEEAMSKGKIEFPVDDGDWQTSLKVVHYVENVEPIPPGAVGVISYSGPPIPLKQFKESYLKFIMRSIFLPKRRLY